MAFQTFDLGRVLQQGEAIKGMKRQGITDQLQQQYLTQNIKAGETAATNVAADREAKLGKDKATQVFTTMQYALQSPDPSAFVEQNAPELIQELSKNGVNWQQVDQPTRLKMLQGIMAKAGAEIGQGPAAPDPKMALDRDKFGLEQEKFAADEAYRNKQLGLERDKMKATATGPDGQPTAPNFGNVMSLRKEYNDASKDFITIGDAYGKIQRAAQNPSAAGDMSLVFGFMKMLDPNSTVREGEYATAQQATGVPGRIVNLYNKALSGEILAPSQREDFIKQAGNVYRSQKTRHEKTVVPRYRAIAERWKINPDDVLAGFDVEESAPAAPQQPQPGALPTVNSPEEAMKLPPGTRFRTPDGREKVRP